MKLVIGLGNPGDKYKATRHNIGWLFLDYLKREFSTNEWQKKDKLKCELLELNYKEKKVLLIKPQTFMNLSGDAVVAVMNFYKLSIDDVIVVYDDIDLNFEEVRFRESGSGGTHNGMKDIVQKLDSRDFARVRLGAEARTAELKSKWALADYVLANFSSEEVAVLPEIFVHAEAKLAEWVAK